MGSASASSDESPLVSAILATLRGAEDGRSMPIKELRKAVLLQLDDEDKKSFKKAVQGLEKDKRLSLSEEGVCKLKKSEMSSGKNKVGFRCLSDFMSSMLNITIVLLHLEGEEGKEK